MTDPLLQPPPASIDPSHWKAFERVIEVSYRHSRERFAALDADTRARFGFAAG